MHMAAPASDPVSTPPGTPEERTEALLAAIVAGEGRLEEAPGADLSGLLAGPQHLRGRVGDPHPSWWSGETNGLNLQGARLRSAILANASLRNANCRGADFTGAVMRSADLSHAVLEQAILEQADLSGATFAGVKAGEAVLQHAMLEDASFEHASLRFVNLRNALIDGANFKGCDLWGAVLDGVDADEAIFAETRLDEASMMGGNFDAADFTGASLKKVKLDGAMLRSASFAGARLEGASLRGADLSRASLPRVNLLSCDLLGVRWAEAWLENTRLRVQQLGGRVGEEMARDFAGAGQAYLVLEQNFRTLGDGDGESWAFRKRRRMGKLLAGHLLRQSLRNRSFGTAAGHLLRWVSDGFVEWLCDYGESLWRTVRAFFVTIILFASFYGVSGTLTHIVQTASGPVREVTRSPTDLLVYSFMNMLSTSAPDIGIKPVNEVVFLLSSLQGALGIVLIGLFGYVLGNRMHR
jgi:uncharacterized protein YjbI with pentapeptide repeats